MKNLVKNPERHGVDSIIPNYAPYHLEPGALHVNAFTVL